MEWNIGTKCLKARQLLVGPGLVAMKVFVTYGGWYWTTTKNKNLQCGCPPGSGPSPGEPASSGHDECIQLLFPLKARQASSKASKD